jgi:predicted Zn-dependent peptidase
LPPLVHTEEPRQVGEKRAAVQSAAQPFVSIGYKRPNQNSPDDLVFDVIAEILSSGRTGMLYTDMVRDKQMALAAMSDGAYPGGKYPDFFVFFLVPNLGHTNEENEKECYGIIERLKKEKVDNETLNRVKTKLRADLIHKLDSNSGLAAELTFRHVAFGDWRRLFIDTEQYAKITADDVQRVAKQYFVPESRTVVYTVTQRQEATHD